MAVTTSPPSSRRVLLPPPPGRRWEAALAYWWLQYKRTWKGSVASRFLMPVMFLVSMGVVLGALVDDRTGGGVGGSRWIPPLADYDPPIHFPWPEYVTTARGRDWVIPAPPRDGA